MRRLIIAVMLFAAVCMANQMQRDMLLFARLASRRSVDTWESAGLNEGLVSYWAMRTNTAVNVVTDEYGTNNATATGGVSFSSDSGVRDDGAKNDGPAASYLSVANTDIGSGVSQLTIAGWFRQSGTGPQILYSRYASTSGSNNRTEIFSHRASLTEAAFIVSSGSLSFGTASLPAAVDGWRHYAMVFDGTQTGNANRLKGYINGVQQILTFTDTIPSTTHNSASRLYIGNQASESPTYRPGSIDEVAIWNRALSSNEVWQIYNTPLYAPYKQ
jgi:hypothetical protein